MSFHCKKFPKMKSIYRLKRKRNWRKNFCENVVPWFKFCIFEPSVFYGRPPRCDVWDSVDITHTYTHRRTPDTQKITQERAGCCKYKRSCFLFWFFLHFLFLFSLLILWRVARIVVGNEWEDTKVVITHKLWMYVPSVVVLCCFFSLRLSLKTSHFHMTHIFLLPFSFSLSPLLLDSLCEHIAKVRRYDGHQIIF